MKDEKIEYRASSAALKLVEPQSTSSPDVVRLSGYAVLFNVKSVDLGGFNEVILPGAFSDSIKGGDVCALFNHDFKLILGRTSNKTLRLWEDQRGLAFTLELGNQSYSQDLAESIKRGDISSMSFSFSKKATVDSWSYPANSLPLRTISRTSLIDISPVTCPAYPQTSVKVVDKAARGEVGAVLDRVEAISSAISRAINPPKVHDGRFYKLKLFNMLNA